MGDDIMRKLWLCLGLIHLAVAVGIFVDQVVVYGIWWEWDEFIHHESFIGILFYAAVMLFIVALVQQNRRTKKDNA
jgi:uncharacterized membrane protein